MLAETPHYDFYMNGNNVILLILLLIWIHIDSWPSILAETPHMKHPAAVKELQVELGMYIIIICSGDCLILVSLVLISFNGPRPH